MKKRTSIGPATFARSKDRCLDDPAPRAPTTNNEYWQARVSHVAPAPQICVRHTTPLTQKLYQALDHVTSRPQVSFAVALWRLCDSSGITIFSNTGLLKRQPTLENMLEVWRFKRHIISW